MEYKVVMGLYSKVTVYKNEKEYLRIETASTFFGKYKVFINKIEMFEYNYWGFMMMSRYKLLKQNFKKKIQIRGTLFSKKKMIIDDSVIETEIKSFLFSKIKANVFLDKELIASLEKLKSNVLSENIYKVIFCKNTKYEFYCLLFLLMQITYFQNE